MSIFDTLFSKPQPAPTAPDVSARPAMTEHRGQVLNANMIIWRVHQYIVDTSISKIIYDKYYTTETEYQARSLANSLNSQQLAGSCINRCDYWGEYGGQTFQAALAQVRERISQDYAAQFERLTQKQSDAKVKAMDLLNKKYYELKQDYINLKADYDKREEDYKNREAQLKAALQRQIDSLREQETTAPPDLDAIRQQVREDEIAKAALVVQERIRIIVRDVIECLANPAGNDRKAARLRHNSDFAGLKGTTQQKLVQYYLYQLLDI